MIQLINIELLKLVRQRRTYYGLLAILLIEIVIMLGAWYQGNEILNTLLDTLTKSFILQGNLMNGNLVQYLILNSLWFNLPLIIIVIVTGILASEYKDETLQSLFLQSINRRKLIFSKYISAFLFTTLSILILGLSSIVASFLLFGKGDLITYLGKLNFIPHEIALQRILLAYLSGTLLLLFYSALSITVVVIFKETITSWIVSVFFLIINGLLAKFDLGQLNYWLLPKLTDSWQLFFQYEVPWSLVLHNHLMLFLYLVVTIMFGAIIFTKRTNI